MLGPIFSLNSPPASASHADPSTLRFETSHQNIWRTVIDSNHDAAMVICPGCNPRATFSQTLERYRPSIPDDWDVILLGGYYPEPPSHVAGHAFRPIGASQIHGYAIRVRACRQFLSQPNSSRFEDAWLALNSAGSLKTYSLWPNLIHPDTGDIFTSFRELGIYGPSRFGNQLFQVAATLAAAARHGYRPQFPAWEYANRFTEEFDQDADELAAESKYIERQFHYVEIPNLPNLDIVGFFQSHRYFAGFEDLIRTYLEPAIAVRAEVAALRADFIRQPTVAIHIRHGDYFTMPERFRVLPIEYYRVAMQRFDRTHHFAIFGDDPAWARQVFRGDNVRIIAGNAEHIDLSLMAACDHQIIANSSFSWWGAWLNKNPAKRVIAPDPWFGPAMQPDMRDLLPADWIKLRA